MRYILKETFLDYLEQNGTKETYFKELEQQARELLDECDSFDHQTGCPGHKVEE